MYVAERAHRVPIGARPLGAPPRPFLVRFLNYRDRDMLLAEAWKHKELKFENARIMLFPDFSTETLRKRRSFTDVKRRLRERELKCSMLYPSHLRVQHKGTVEFFESPQDASDWLDQNLWNIAIPLRKRLFLICSLVLYFVFPSFCFFCLSWLIFSFYGLVMDARQARWWSGDPGPRYLLFSWPPPTNKELHLWSVCTQLRGTLTMRWTLYHGQSFQFCYMQLSL